MIAVYIVIGLVAGAFIMFLVMKLVNIKVQSRINILDSENSRLSQENSLLSTNLDSINSENKALNSEKTELALQIKLLEQSKNDLLQQFDRERTNLAKNAEIERQNSDRLRAENEKQWQIKFDKLKEEFQNTANKLFEAKQASLQESNKEQLGEILKPIREQFEAFKKSVDDSRTSGEVSKKELKDAFEATMKLFAQQQNNAVEALKQETIRIGNDANNLTNALKRDTKKQGNWGELILETILESSGLEKDTHYFIQETVRDEEGKMLRPDIIVRFPEGRSVIIDSKVSLTAYTEAFESDDVEVKRRRLKDHAKSVRKHVEELAGKKYDTVVDDAIGFILMFIPNDQCYLSAIEEDPDLSRYAYSKGIVVISPSNLLMALQLAFNMWQQDVRNKNIDNIVKTASDLYDKVANFSESMESVEKNLSQLSVAFHRAKSQLYEGSGNIMRRVENLKSLGVTPKKQIKGLPANEE